MLDKYSKNKQIYFILHFNHPNEITAPSVEAIKKLQLAGGELANQTPLIKGVNDNSEVLAELFRELSCLGVPPYYVFQCRPAAGNKPYAVPIETGYEIFEEAKAKVSGLAKRARYVMSHATGKIEIIAKTDNHIILKYHRDASNIESGRILIFKSNPKAYWLDDYYETTEEYALDWEEESGTWSVESGA